MLKLPANMARQQRQRDSSGLAGLKPASLQGKLRQTARQEAGKKKRGQQKPRRPKMESGKVLHCNCHHTMFCMGVVNVCHAVPQHMRPSTPCIIQLQFDVQGRKRLSRALCCLLQGPAQSRMPNHPVRSARTVHCSYGLMTIVAADKVVHCSLLHSHKTCPCSACCRSTKMSSWMWAAWLLLSQPGHPHRCQTGQAQAQ